MTKRIFLSGLAATLGASALLFSGMAGSASAIDLEPVRPDQVKNVQTGLCLDSDTQGKAYTNPCRNDNKYQQWWVHFNDAGQYQLENRQTGLCLQAGSGDSVVTASCSATKSAQWWTLNGIGNQRYVLSNVANGRSLDSNQKGQAYTSPHSLSNPYMQWWLW
ncbi:RICIN domain-containing protein [Streptomyces sp. NPDC006656]|uniref:RICIN domain-containing protein n=1 Tax=Streptomyces sp. NPDC006656 TaxID=3156899 RepID=UPI003452B06A